MSDSRVPPDLDPVHGRADDPLSADRRVLIIGAVSMVVLIVIGAVSASVFTRSACGAIAPDAVAPRTAGDDLQRVLGDGLPDLFDDERVALAEFLGTDLAGRLGPLAAAADVSGAESLATVGGVEAGLVAALGSTTTVFEAATGAVRATASVGEGAVVGSGSGLYSLALTNPATGQVDAIIPLDQQLQGGDCLDTATVATPFSFLLGADQGQLVLFRVEEDGETPQVELRDATQGQLWATDLQTPQLPPGVSGERLDAAAGLEQVVVARRSTDDDELPAISAFARDSGQERWNVHLDAMTAVAPAGSGPIWIEVVAVGSDTVLVSLARDDARDAAVLVALGAADGHVQWRADADLLAPIDAQLGEEQVTVLAIVGGELQALRLDTTTGEVVAVASRPADEPGEVAGSVVDLGGGQALATAGRGVLLVGSDEIAGLGYDREHGARIVDAVRVGDATVVLVSSGDGAVAVSFGTP